MLYNRSSKTLPDSHLLSTAFLPINFLKSNKFLIEPLCQYNIWWTFVVVSGKSKVILITDKGLYSQRSCFQTSLNLLKYLPSIKNSSIKILKFIFIVKIVSNFYALWGFSKYQISSFWTEWDSVLMFFVETTFVLMLIAECRFSSHKSYFFFVR